MLHRIWLGFFVIAFGSGLYRWLVQGDTDVFQRMVKATFDALANCASPRQVAAKRGKKVSDIVGRRDHAAVAETTDG